MKNRGKKEGKAEQVVLIGFGSWALDAHVPPLEAWIEERLRKEKYSAKLLVVDLNKGANGAARQVDFKRHFFTFDREKFPAFAANAKLLLVPKDTRLHDWLPRTIGLQDAAVIVATPPVSHYDYASDALEAGAHVLVDKPLSVRERCWSNVKEAEEISKGFERLRDLAKRKKRVFMLGTQKRYQSAYKLIGDRLSAVGTRTGYGVTAVQVVTNDGYWLLPEDYEHQEFHGYWEELGGGKITHTGYHFLDLVPWLMRQARARAGHSEVCGAEVTTHLFRPLDSIAASPFHARKDGYTKKLGPYSDVNAFIMVRFFDENMNTQCVAQFSLLHEGLSLRTRTGRDDKQLTEGRVKVDSIALFQGPVFFASLRRIAKLLPKDAGPTDAIGGRDHVELVLASNPSCAGEPKLTIVPPGQISETGSDSGCGDDALPTTEFLSAAFSPPGTIVEVRSPVSDHEIGIKLLSAAYESAAKAQAGRTTEVHVTVKFDKWERPPGLGSPLLKGPSHG